MQENYEAYLRKAKETLDLNLIPRDCAKVERGIFDMEWGHSLLKSDDPAELRLAASLLMTGAAIIMGTCGASPSAKKYFDRDHGRGGSAPRTPTLEWHAKALKWLDGRIKEGGPTTLKGADLARRCIGAVKGLPVGERHLAAFFNQELKRRKHANKVVPIRA